MGPEAAPADLPPDERTARLVALVGECLAGRLAAEAFVELCERLLVGLALYPHGPVLATARGTADRLETSPGLAVDITLRMVSSASREVRGFTSALIWRLARFQPGLWVHTARLLLCDEDWEVRDLAARVFDQRAEGEGAVQFHPDYVCDAVASWAADSDERVRRAASQALLGYAEREIEFRRRLLALLNPLLADESEYVRRSYAGALRTLGRADPALILEYLEAAASNLNEHSSDTIRTALDHPFADRFPERKAALLSRLASAEPGH